MKETLLMEMVFIPSEVTTRGHCFDRMETFSKHIKNPVLIPEYPWESSGVYYPTVIYSQKDNLFKMWYLAIEKEAVLNTPGTEKIDNVEIGGKYFICYAVSKDGIEWIKQNIGKKQADRFPGNNIVLEETGYYMGNASVIEDNDDPDITRLYKMVIYSNNGKGNDGLRTAVSPDGIEWEFTGEFPMLPSQDTCSLFYDKRQQKYFAFLKVRIGNRRARMVSTSIDFNKWTDPEVLLLPDSGDSPTMHFYSESMFYSCGRYFGLLNRYEMCVQKADLELIYSPDGMNWHRLPCRYPVLGPGDSGSWDEGGIYSGLGEPIISGNQCSCYYGGTNMRHDVYEGFTGSIGIASFEYGRILGQQFEGDGWFNSIPFRCPGGMLFINAVARKPLRVEICLSGYGGVYKGFEASECNPVTGDDHEHKIIWKTKSNLNELKDKFIEIKVFGCDSIVYSAMFCEAVKGIE